MSRLSLAIDRIEQARKITRSLVDTVDPAQWFTMPAGCPSNVGWQLGHIAVSSYGLCLVALRQMQPEDSELFSRDLRRNYGRGTTPQSDSAANSSPEELLAAYSAVHEKFLSEISSYKEEDLVEPMEKPHPLFSTRLEAIEFASTHEALHAGQIGLIRRMLGADPLR